MGVALQTTGHRRDYRSRTALEAENLDLIQSLERSRLDLFFMRERFNREVETSLRVGISNLMLEQENGNLRARLDFAQNKLGHRV